ncbi:hypothetical protein [Dokdonia sp.]|uniref:hypothetical protein n=1 Tax=Dokdonia sp. TaxID=2024995 RepID=UPI0032640CBD
MWFKTFIHKNRIDTQGWPNHPLYNQLCEKAYLLLPKLKFKRYQIGPGKLSFISKEKMVVSIIHGGYDMPYVYIGTRENPEICCSWKPLEYYLDPLTPISKKHQNLKSFYDFEYDYDLIKNYYKEILHLIDNPKEYKEWESTEESENSF